MDIKRTNIDTEEIKPSIMKILWHKAVDYIKKEKNNLFYVNLSFKVLPQVSWGEVITKRKLDRLSHMVNYKRKFYNYTTDFFTYSPGKFEYEVDFHVGALALTISAKFSSNFDVLNMEFKPFHSGVCLFDDYAQAKLFYEIS